MTQYATDRCVLSRLCENDIPEAIRLLTDPQVREFLGGPVPSDVAVPRIIGWINAPDSIHYAVRNKETNALEGDLSRIIFTKFENRYLGTQIELRTRFKKKCAHRKSGGRYLLEDWLSFLTVVN